MRVLAYYLPQFHEIRENDEWWGKGFTEWSNVRKAKRLYNGHEQPKIPGELGYYNLLDEEARIKQALLAEEHGIEGFCYWHYWFGNGDRLLEKPINEVLASGKPNFPFCFGWANESWKAKVWGEKGKADKLLIEQKYPGDQDIVDHFNSCLNAFKDSRYVTIESKPVFVIYKPFLVPNVSKFIKIWQDLAKNEGLEGVFFIGHTHNSIDIEKLSSLGFDAINIVRNGEWLKNKIFLLRNFKSLIRYKLFNMPYIISYSKIMKLFSSPKHDTDNRVFPTLIPNWDHTARSGNRGYLYHGSTPELFGRHVETVLNTIKHKPQEKQVVFLKSWNEWGEGNYIEPDFKFGRKYLVALKTVIEKFKSQ